MYCLLYLRNRAELTQSGKCGTEQSRRCLMSTSIFGALKTVRMSYPRGRVAFFKKKPTRHKRGARGARGTQRQQQRQRATRIQETSVSLRTRNCRSEGEGEDGVRRVRVRNEEEYRNEYSTSVLYTRSEASALQSSRRRSSTSTSTQYGENFVRTPVKYSYFY